MCEVAVWTEAKGFCGWCCSLEFMLILSLSRPEICILKWIADLLLAWLKKPVPIYSNLLNYIFSDLPIFAV